MRPLVALPKAHLHLHLAGALRAATLAELAAAVGLDAAGPDDVLTSVDAIRRLVAEVVVDAARCGAVWVEPSLRPERWAEHLGGTEAVLETVLDALAGAGSRHGVGTGLLLTADRSDGPAAAVAQARLAVRYAADGVVAFGLDADGTEPVATFLRAFAIARDGGLLLAPLLTQRDGPEAVASAVADLDPDRVQHGVRAAEDPDLVVRLADGGTCLDVSPTTDVAAGRIATLDDHPVADLLDAGVPCSLNAPEPLRHGTDLLDEFEAARHQLAFDDVRLAALARTSIAASGAPDALKARADETVDAWLASDVDVDVDVDVGAAVA